MKKGEFATKLVTSVDKDLISSDLK
jgi:hypothetical protein